jgi:hypothetical protein
LEATIAASIGFRIADLAFMSFSLSPSVSREPCASGWAIWSSVDQLISFHIAWELAILTGSTAKSARPGVTCAGDGSLAVVIDCQKSHDFGTLPTE